MDEGRHNEAAAYEVERSTGASLRHFKSGCFITEGACTFDMTNECMEASYYKASFWAQAQSGPGALSTLIHKSYLR